MKLKAIFFLLKETFWEWRRDDASQLAAALAFYTVISFAPMLVIIIAITGLAFGQEAVQGKIVREIRGWVGQSSAEFIQTVIASVSELKSGIIATVVSIVTVLIGATRLFDQLQNALNKIWGVRSRPGRGIKGILRDRLLAFIMVLGMGLLLLVFLITSAVLTAVSQFLGHLLSIPAYVQVVDFIVSFSVITVLFAMIYKVLPDVKIAWSDVSIGAAVTSLLFTIGKALIGWYLGRSSVGSAYGAAASLFIILIWVYYSAQVFFFGAEFTQVYTERYGSSMVPTKNAVRVSRVERNEENHPETDGEAD